MAWRLITVQHCNTPTVFDSEPIPNPLMSVEDLPALYFLNEIRGLLSHNHTPEELREVHKAKLAYAGVRLWQDG